MSVELLNNRKKILETKLRHNFASSKYIFENNIVSLAIKCSAVYFIGKVYSRKTTNRWQQQLHLPWFLGRWDKEFDYFYARHLVSNSLQ
jgi:hypothetical protein